MRRAAVLLWLVATGCSALTFTEEGVDPGADPARGEFRVRAPRRGRAQGQARGFVYQVVGPDQKLLAAVESRGGPWSFENLPPGRYGLQISGEGIRALAVDVKIKPGVRTTVSFHAGRARTAKAPEDLAVVTGKGLFYVVLGIVYIPYLLCVDILDDDEEDDALDLRIDASNSASRKKDPEERPEDKSRPRVRSLLQEP